MAEDALDHVYVDVLLSQQRAGSVPGVVEPGVLGDGGSGEQCLPLFPVVVRVDRLAFRPAPDEVAVVPGVSGGSPFGVLAGEVLPVVSRACNRTTTNASSGSNVTSFGPSRPTCARWSPTAACRGLCLTTTPCCLGRDDPSAPT